MKIKFINMLEVTRKADVCKVALWTGDTQGQARAFCKEHGLPSFPIATLEGNQTGLLIPSKSPTGITIAAIVPKGSYITVVNDHLGTWLKPMTQAELDDKYDYEREVSE